MKFGEAIDIVNENGCIVVKEGTHIMKQKVKKYLLKIKKEIQFGRGIDREIIPINERGKIAKDLWDDSKFSIGSEYGAIAMLLKLIKEFEL